MAKIEPKNIDVAEVHDAFSVCELMAISELGITSNDKSGEFVRNLFNTENRMINPRGGLIGAGHPFRRYRNISNNRNHKSTSR